MCFKICAVTFNRDTPVEVTCSTHNMVLAVIFVIKCSAGKGDAWDAFLQTLSSIYLNAALFTICHIRPPYIGAWLYV